jgi:hypothetical protein
VLALQVLNHQLVDMMDEIMTKYSCDAKWLVFVDIDIFIYDFAIQLETYINRANEVYGTNSSHGCSIIGKLSPSDEACMVGFT